MSGKNGSQASGEGGGRLEDARVASFDENARRERVDALVAEGRAIRQFDLEKLEFIATEALILSHEPGPDGGEYELGTAGALSLIAYYNASRGDCRDALSTAQRALGMIDLSTPSQLLGDLYDSMGWAHFSMGSFVDALNQLIRSIGIAEEIGDVSLMASALDTMGNVHTVSGHPEAALDLFLRAIEIHHDGHDVLNEALSSNNLVYAYLGLGRDDEALELALRALEQVRGCGEASALTCVLDTVAEAALALGRLDDAETYSREALEISREHDLARDETNCLLTCGNLQRLRGDLDEAVATTAHALELAEQQQRSVEVATAHARIAEIEEERGNLDVALQHFRLFHELEGRRVSSETQAQLASLRVEYQVESSKKDAEIHRLRNLALEREVEQRRIAQTRLEAQASLDPLTGLFNRRHLPVLAEELERALAAGKPASVVVCDIDRFKRVNDLHGHLAGDQTLALFARHLRDQGHDGDTTLRLGGDEFLIVLIGADGAAARRRAERLRASLSEAFVLSGDAKVAVTASFGVVAVHPGSACRLDDLIGEADRALYEAKNAGRDCVVGCEL
jgi:diguanylate cyclase (GGDEF)-like protein